MTRTGRSEAQEISSREGLNERTHRGRGDVGIDDMGNYARLVQNDDTGSVSLPYSKRNTLSDNTCDSECKAQTTASKKSKRATVPQNMNTSDGKTTEGNQRTTTAPTSTNLTSASSGSNRSPDTPASSSKQTISSVTDLLFVVPNEIVIKPAENSKVQSEIKTTEKLIQTSLEGLLLRVPGDSSRQQPHDGTDSVPSQDSDLPEVNTEPSDATTLRELTRQNANVASVTSTTDATSTQFQDETPTQSTSIPHKDSAIPKENKTDSAAKDTTENGEHEPPADNTENGKSKSNSITRQEKLVLRTACLPIGSLGKFKVQDTTYQVRGMGAGHIAAECWREVSNVVNDHIKLPYLDETTLVATTAFYFIATSANLIEPEMTYGYVRVEQFRQAADTMCERRQKQFPDPLACLDYQYAAALLKHGLHLSDKTEILVCDKIQGFRLGWALGAALNYLQRH
ncbi:flocculation protein FLO11-like [Penaeus monodon]|uniref:flocculation protein FLO11-like n=1 Tax=Penaeus monodon TaxID=6687 RepID=UPI0018A762D6|nr:flocculation protein FLO11-like [Penaeus monodon]